MINPFTKYLWKTRKINMTIFAIYALVMIGVVFGIMDKYYTADVSLLPPAGSSALQGRLNTLASLVGMTNLGSNFLSLEMYESIIHSRKLETKLLHTHFQFPENGQEKKVKLLDYLEIEGENKREIYEKAFKLLNEDVIYTEVDEITNMMLLKVTLKNPFLAAQVANKIVHYLDSLVQEHLTKEFREQYAYITNRMQVVEDSIATIEKRLKKFLERTVDVTTPEHIVERMRLERELTVQTTVFAELKKQQEMFLMQNMFLLSPVKVLDYAQPPYRKSRPKRILVLLALWLIGAFVQLSANGALVFYREFKTKIIPSLQ